MEHGEVLTCALDIGEYMLSAGGEVYRVEDCIRRICGAYGASSVDVLTITSTILLTLEFPGEQRITQTRRITSYLTDMERVHQLNQLSRELCMYTPSYDRFNERFTEILSKKVYPHWILTIAYAMVAAAFTVFFGGGWQEAAISALIGAVLKWTVYLTSQVTFNRVLSNMIASFVMSAFAFCAVHLQLAPAAGMIIIGNIMLLIPGVALTNSLRDMISGDTISGLLRFAEAIIFALAIAAGYSLAAFLVGGGLV